MLGLFFSWRLLIIVFSLLSIAVIPPKFDFLGGGFENYIKAPLIWGWANFLSIAQNGYSQYEHAFFPFYPLLIKIVSGLLGKSLLNYNYAALLVTHFSLFFALIGLYQLSRKEYGDKAAKYSLLLLLLFPTAFFLGSVYNESLFLALSVWSFYFARRDKWLFAGILGFFAAATRVVGIFLLPALFIETLKSNESKKIKYFALALIPLGLACYIYYLNNISGNPLLFISDLSVYGGQRQPGLTLLPQVFYRYLFKILPNINYFYFPTLFYSYLELFTAMFFSVIIVLLFFKSRLSYALYSLLAFITPTLTGSFSSLPRYVLIIFPAFMLCSYYLSKLKVSLRFCIFFILFIISAIATALFFRGYWLA